MTNLKKYLIELKKAQTTAEENKWFTLFYNETFKFVFNYCRKKGLAADLAKDISQNVYYKIYTKKAHYNPDHSPMAWLYIITQSETKDVLKKAKTYQTYMTEYENFVNLSQNQFDDPIIHQKEINLDVLSETEKQVIEDRFYLESEFTEIAKKLNLTDTNVRKVVSRSLSKLRKFYGK